MTLSAVVVLSVQLGEVAQDTEPTFESYTAPTEMAAGAQAGLVKPLVNVELPEATTTVIPAFFALAMGVADQSVEQVEVYFVEPPKLMLIATILSDVRLLIAQFIAAIMSDTEAPLELSNTLRAAILTLGATPSTIAETLFP